MLQVSPIDKAFDASLRPYLEVKRRLYAFTPRETCSARDNNGGALTKPQQQAKSILGVGSWQWKQRSSLGSHTQTARLGNFYG